MRRPVDAFQVGLFRRTLGLIARHPASVYFVGGATAVLNGWRAATEAIDLEVRSIEDITPLLVRLREELGIAIELTSPDRFIPRLTDWEERSPYIGRDGVVKFYHYDLYSQALAKIERGFARDSWDVGEMLDRGWVVPAKLLDLFESIRFELPQFPAVDAVHFESAVRCLVSSRS